MKKVLYVLLFITYGASAQNKNSELTLLLQQGKINLIPRYGNGIIQKTSDFIEVDNKFIASVTSQYGTKDSACKVYNLYGWSQFYRGDATTAMKRFNQAWLLDTNNASEYFGFSAVLTIIKDDPQAYFGSATTAELIKLEDPKVYYAIGVQKDTNKKSEKNYLLYTSEAFELYGKYDLAIEACNKLLELNPADTLSLHQRGHLYTYTLEWQKSITDLTNAFPHGGKNAYALNDIGYAYENLGDTRNAFLYYAQASDVNPEYLTPIYNRALLMLKTGDAELALEYIDKCIALKKDAAELYKSKGEILLKLDKKSEGINCLKKAKKMGDKDAGKILEGIK